MTAFKQITLLMLLLILVVVLSRKDKKTESKKTESKKTESKKTESKKTESKKINITINDKNPLFTLPLEYLKKRQEIKATITEFVDETIHTIENGIGKHIMASLEGFINL